MTSEAEGLDVLTGAGESLGVAAVHDSQMSIENKPFVTHLEALDGVVDVPNAHLLLCTSKLVQALTSLPPGAQHVYVPFSRQDVEGWRDFLVDSNRSLSTCLAALKVDLPPLTMLAFQRQMKRRLSSTCIDMFTRFVSCVLHACLCLGATAELCTQSRSDPAFIADSLSPQESFKYTPQVRV